MYSITEKNLSSYNLSFPCWENRNMEQKVEGKILDLQVFRYLLASWKIKLDG